MSGTALEGITTFGHTMKNNVVYIMHKKIQADTA